MDKFNDKVTSCLTASFFCSLVIAIFVFFSIEFKASNLGIYLMTTLGITGVMWIYNILILLPLSYLKEFLLRKINIKGNVLYSSILLGGLSFLAGIFIVCLLSYDFKWMFLFLVIPGTLSGLIYPSIERWG